jgi:hypothetical protein
MILKCLKDSNLSVSAAAVIAAVRCLTLDPCLILTKASENRTLMFLDKIRAHH